MADRNPRIDRREFLKTTAAGVAAAGIVARSAQADGGMPDNPAAAGATIHRNENPAFSYRRLGRTNFNCGRIVAGWMKEPSLLRKMLAGGVNYLDTARGYGEYEVELADMLKTIRDKVWITSKATDIAGHATVDSEVQKLYREAMKKFLGSGKITISVSDRKGKKESTREVAPGEAPREAFLGVHKECLKKMKATGEQPDWRPVGKRISEMYARKLDESLSRMKIDCVDCYMVHGIEIPWIFQCLELWETFEKAQKAGKTKHFGFSTHANQKDVLAAGVEANAKGPWKIDLIMPGVNPSEESFHNYRPELEAFKKQDVGIIAMKTSGTIRHAVGKREEKLAELVEGRKLNEWERAKMYMLHVTDNLIDACIAKVDNAEQLGRTLDLPKIQLAAAARKELEAIVRLEMGGACSLCGDCTTACPEDIAVADLLRYHAYTYQYDDRALAAELYHKLGYDPGKRCTSCGTCADACPASIDLVRAINEVVEELA